MCRSNAAFILAIASITLLLPLSALRAESPVGASGHVGCFDDAKKVSRLEITESGVYENYRVDAAGMRGNHVKITADNVTVRNCEIRNGAGNGIGVFAPNVTIENCRIHHMLASSFAEQKDAHGITGRWGNVVIRNCDISYCSGDCIQFDPDRRSAGSALIENCTLWTGPLPADAANFKAGQRPGENAVDTKTKPDGPRCKLTIRNTYMHGFNQPAQISNAAALNLKENVDAEVEHCVLADNEIAFRLRGPGQRGGAHVRVEDCAVYNSQIGVRAENKIEQLKLIDMAFGKGVVERIRFVGGEAGPGYETNGEHSAPPLEARVQTAK